MHALMGLPGQPLGTLRVFGPSGVQVPRIGQGTWQMGHDPTREAEALRCGLDLGLTHIDTAEMYTGAEAVVREAIRGRRDAVFLVSKVLPSNADFAGTIAACERSLARLGTDCLDLYLLHWPGSHPLAETMSALEELVKQGKTRHIGVSNFDVDEMQQAQAALTQEPLACNQVHYDLENRGVELRLIPACQERSVALVGYSPFGQGRLPRGPGWSVLEAVAQSHGATPTQVILAFLTRQPGTFTIPKAATQAHVEDNAGALELTLTPKQIALIDAAFPAPDRDVPLSVR